MKTIKIAVVIGSLRTESINRKLANALSAMAPAGFQFDLVPIAELPHYNQDEEATPTVAIVAFRGAISTAEAVLFVTPEFNRSIPGALKNAIDIGSRPYGRSVWAGKIAGVIGASPSSVATALAQQHLRNILAHLDMKTMGQPEGFIQTQDGFFDADGKIANEGSKKFLQSWIEHYCSFVKANS